eukprot:m.74438 g.74438  ORF g.74438 m.74438 type:complete len:735 (-) comp8053_c0_seq2:3365-5569(-)
MAGSRRQLMDLLDDGESPPASPLRVSHRPSVRAEAHPISLDMYGDLDAPGANGLPHPATFAFETQRSITPPDEPPPLGLLGSSPSRGGSVRQMRTTAVQTDEFIADPVPAKISMTMRQRQSHGLGYRRTLRRNQVAPLDLELDSPRRLKERENVRAQKNYWALKWHDLKTWWHLKRTRRRDPTPLWRQKIKIIEGHFGSGMASFFVFIRWLFLLNFMQACFWLFPVILPAAVKFDYDARLTQGFRAINLVDGRGAIGQSWVFFGGYDEIVGDSYRMYLAYVSVIIIVFLVCFFAILRNIALSIGQSRASLINVDRSKPYSVVVLTSWDHSINQPPGVKNLRLGVSNALFDLLGEDRLRARKWRAERTAPWRLYGVRAAVWILWLCFLAGCFLAVWFLIQYSDDSATEDSSTSFGGTYAAVFVFSFINGVVPFCMTKLAKLEGYHKKIEMKITIGRTFAVRMIALYALLYGLYRSLELTAVQEPVFSEGTIVDQTQCAGTVIGQELMKAFIVDTLFSLCSRIFINVAWFSYYGKKLELDMAQGVLALVYRQGMVWIGMIFCPMFPTIALISNILFFYVYYHLVLRTCRPPTHRWNSHRHNSYFMGFLTITFLMVLIPASIALQTYKPNCGPYGSERFDSIYDGIWEWSKDQNSAFKGFLDVITSPAFTVPLVMCFGVVMYFMLVQVRMARKQLREANGELKDLLHQRRNIFSSTVTKDETVPWGWQSRSIRNTDV